MPKDKPFTEPFERYKKLLNEAQEKIKGFPKLAYISHDLAIDLAKMDADDWYYAFNECTPIEECRVLANRLLKDPTTALDGSKFGEVHPILFVSDELKDDCHFKLIDQ